MATVSPREANTDLPLQLGDAAPLSCSEPRYIEQQDSKLLQDPDYASTYDFSILVNPAQANRKSPSVTPPQGYVSMINRPLPPPPVPPRLIIDTTLPLEDQMWYHGVMTAATAEIILSKHEVFSFLVRKSTRNPDWYALSVRKSEANYDIDGEQFLHFRIKRTSDNKFDAGNAQFESIPKFIECCTRNNFMVSFIRDCGSYTLRHPVKRQDIDRITTSCQ